MVLVLTDDDVVHVHDDARGVSVACACDHDVRDACGDGHDDAREAHDRGDRDDGLVQQMRYTDGANVANANVDNGGDDRGGAHDGRGDHDGDVRGGVRDDVRDVHGDDAHDADALPQDAFLLFLT